MHVLVTRPEEDSRRTADRLRALGFEASIAPLIEIVLEPIASSALDGAVAVIATSRNAVRSLIASKDAHAAALRLPLFAVGGGTEALARGSGLNVALRGPGSAAELAPLVAERLAGTSGRVAVLAGDVTAFDMAAALETAGLGALTIAAYRSVAAPRLPSAVADDLHRGRIDAVMLMSPRTAATWDRTTEREPASARAVTHICLSRQVADALSPEPGRGKVVIADRPSLDAMLALTKRLDDRNRSG